ncbi:MAG: ribosomal protein L7/L12 [Emticicia sp.]|nr:ribosomal protein L7/L12 [Emticicia sp.]
MKKIFFVIALAIAGLSTVSNQTQAQSTFQKEQQLTLFIRASQSNAKQSVAKVLSSMFGMNFGATMKQLNQGGVVVLPLKTGVTKEEAATIKSALEAAGAEVEVK